MCFVELHADRDFEASLRPGVLTTRSAIPAASACMVSETFPSRSGIHWQYFTCTQLARVRSLFSTITSAQLHRCCFFLLRACTHADSENATPAMQRTDDARTIDLEHALRGLARFDRSTRCSSGSLVLLCLGGGVQPRIGTITAALHIRLLCDPAMPGLVGAVAAAWSHHHDDDTAPRGRAVQAHFVRVACCICSTKLIYTGCSAARSLCYDACVLY